MLDFEYRYRRWFFLLQALFATLFIGSILFWMHTAWNIFSQFPSPLFSDAAKLNVFTIIMTGVPIFMLIIGFCFLIPALYKLLVPVVVIGGNGQGIEFRGSWLKKYNLAWSEIEYVRYNRETSIYRGSSANNYRSSIHTSSYLLIKPVNGRSVKVDITNLDGAVDDIIGDMKKYAPNLVVKGLD